MIQILGQWILGGGGNEAAEKRTQVETLVLTLLSFRN